LSERTYTVRELDALRNVVNHKWLWGRYVPDFHSAVNGLGISRSYREEERVKAVEELVRTHMLAGHTAKDLCDSEQQPRPASGEHNPTD
jgi:hypothetical protein